MQQTFLLWSMALGLMTGGCAFAQNAQYEIPHKWTVTVKVIGDDGRPVTGANVSVPYPDPHPRTAKSDDDEDADESRITGLTDTNGMFVASHSSRPGFSDFLVGVHIEKEGYYPTRIEHDFGPGYDSTKWNPTFTLTFKKIVKPIAMYAKRLIQDAPALGQPIGYDLTVGDWVYAGHKGVKTDIVFQQWAYRNSGADYEYKTKVSFPTNGDGIQVYRMKESDNGSELRTPHEAPPDGYQPELNKETSVHPGQAAKNDSDPNGIYFFRVRTALDTNGIVTNALYGKIYGDFMNFTYFLNPTPNDRNIEFDTKKNLIQGSRVSVP